MTPMEILEKHRPKHYKDNTSTDHDESTCETCEFDKAVSYLFIEAKLRSATHERKECSKIVMNQIEHTNHWTIWARFHLEEVLSKIIARGDVPQ